MSASLRLPSPPPPPVRGLELRLSRALQAHRAGDLAAAEPGYRAVLRRAPYHAEALALLGLLHAQAGRPAEAAPLLRRAIRLSPGEGHVHANLGNVLVELGEHAAALASYGRALALDPDHAAAHLGRGNALMEMARNAEALAAVDRALALLPDLPEGHNNRGNALRALARPAEALESYDRALALRPLYPAAHANRGTALADLGRGEEALVSLELALMLAPGDPSALDNRGAVLRGLGRLEAALASHEAALARAPGLASAHGNRAVALAELGRHAEALAATERAIALAGPGESGLAEAWNSRGNALTELGRVEEALSCFDRVEALSSGQPRLPYNRGNAMRALGRHEEAVALYRRAQAMEPGMADAHWNESLSLLALGRMAEGFAKYEWRWRRKGASPMRHAAAPAWEGERMAGRTLLLHAEQGLGDTIHFARYVELAAARGARVVLEAQAPVLPLLRGLPGVSALVAQGEPVPEFDAQCPLMSLPRVLGVEEAPPAAPYLRADPARITAWRTALPPARLRVGIVCSGNPSHLGDRARSVPLADFAPVLGMEAGFVFLQTDRRAADDAVLAATPGLLDLRPRLTCFAETAAALTQVDVLVSVDTSVAHLAGALGRPVLLLVPPLADWRWGLEGAETPLYPSMRLLRRGRAEGWADVLDRAATMLAGFTPGARG